MYLQCPLYYTGLILNLYNTKVCDRLMSGHDVVGNLANQGWPSLRSLLAKEEIPTTGKKAMLSLQFSFVFCIPDEWSATSRVSQFRGQVVSRLFESETPLVPSEMSSSAISLICGTAHRNSDQAGEPSGRAHDCWLVSKNDTLCSTSHSGSQSRGLRGIYSLCFKRCGLNGLPFIHTFKIRLNVIQATVCD